MSKKAAKFAGKALKGAISKAPAVSTFLETYIPAGKAMPAPPLGPQLGQVYLKLIIIKLKFLI